MFHMAWESSTLPVEVMEVLHAAGGCGSAPHCPWRAWKCSTLLVEGVELSHTACGGYGSVPHCPWRARKCSMLPVEGMERLQAGCRGCGRAQTGLKRLKWHKVAQSGLKRFQVV